MAPSLGAPGITYLDAHQWEVSLSYRWLHSDSVYVGHREVLPLKGTGYGNGYAIDLTTTYAFTRRFSLSLDLPFFYGEHHWAFEHDGVTGHSMVAAGLGDVSLSGNAWLFDPATHGDGNISLSLGVKAPTGDYNAKDTTYRPTGPVERPVDHSTQPGDGGWGILLQAQAFQRIFKNTHLYAAGFYLINPRQKNGTENVQADYPDGVIHINGVPDQYMARMGLSYAVWPEKGLSLSLGPRVDGIPVRDLIGGGDDGLRRPGYTLSIEPGLSLVWGKNVFTMSAPVVLDRNRFQNVLEKQLSTALGTTIRGGAAIADFQIIASISRRF